MITFASSAPLKPGRLARDLLQRGVRRQRALAAVQPQDLQAPVHVGDVDHDLAVEAARAQQRGVEDVGAVGRAHHDQPAVAGEAVHLDEDLVERLLALVVALADARAALAPGGVELVDEDDRRRRPCAPCGTGRARAPRRRRRATRRSPSPTRRRRTRPLRRPRPWPAASCRCPGGPTSSTPLGAAAPTARYLLRVGQVVADLRSSASASPAPATSANVILSLVPLPLLPALARELRERRRSPRRAAFAAQAHEQREQAHEQQDRDQELDDDRLASPLPDC